MHNESMSALLDSECTAADVDRLLDACERSPDLKAQWSRLCLARDVHRGLRTHRVDPDFASRVMAALEGDTEVAVANEAPPAKKVARQAAFSWRWQRVVGLAAAASVATLAVSLWMVRPGATEPAGAPVAFSAPPASAAAFQSVAVSAPASAVRADGAPTARRAPMDSEFERQLEAYVLDHSNYRLRPGTSGALGYARFAAHNATQKAVYTAEEGP